MSDSDLPPSPPLTEESSLASPAVSFSHSHLHPDSPPTSPKTSNSPSCATQITPTLASLRTSAPPVRSPLERLTPELFFAVLSLVPQRDRPRLGLVSRAWHAFLVNEPRLWPHLNVNLGEDQSDHIQTWVDRAQPGEGAKAEAGVKSVTIVLPHRQSTQEVFDDTIDRDELEHKMRALFAKLARQSKGSFLRREKAPSGGVRRLEVVAHPSTAVSARLCTWTVFSSQLSPFKNLRELKLSVFLANPQLSRWFMSAWPEIEHMDLTFYRSSYKGINEGQPFNLSLDPTHRPQVASLDRLRSISWRGLNVPNDLRLPPVPALTRLTLHEVEWDGQSLQLLVRLARHSLEEIDICDLSVTDLEPDEAWENWQANVNVTHPALTDGWVPPKAQSSSNSSLTDSDEDGEFEDDEPLQPPPISLPALRKLALSGPHTPALFSCSGPIDWADEENTFPGPTWHMPALRECELELDWSCDPSECPLVALAANAPALESFSLTRSSAAPMDIFRFLSARGPSLRFLSVQDGHGMTNQLLHRLPELTPRLEHLDVRSCAQVSVSAVARLVEAMRDRSEGHHRLQRVQVDGPDWDHHEWQAWQWLQFHGVLVRDEVDWEGTGPHDAETKRQWVKLGKMDSDSDARLQREKQQREARETADLKRRAREEHLALVEDMRQRISRGEGTNFTEINYGPVMPWPDAIHQSNKPSRPKPAQRRKVSAQEDRQAEFELRAQALGELGQPPVDQRLVAAHRGRDTSDFAPSPFSQGERERSTTPVVDICLDDEESAVGGRKRSSASMSDGENDLVAEF